MDIQLTNCMDLYKEFKHRVLVMMHKDLQKVWKI